MHFTDIFIRRPVLSVSISLLLVLFGLYALQSMSFRQYPKMTNTVITITTSYYGADTHIIQGFVTQPLEQAIAQANNIDYITSKSYMGTSSIKVHMMLNTNPDSALADILSKVNSVRSKLPKSVQDPVLSLSTGATTSLIYIAFSSHDLNASQITDYLTRVVRPKLLTIRGVAKANIYGGSDFAMRVWLNPAKMAAYNLTTSDVTNTLKSNNLQSAPGQINNYFIKMNVIAKTQVSSVKQLENLVVRSNPDGSVLRLSDIATVSLSKGRDTVRAYAQGKNAVILAIDPTPRANPLAVVQRVKDQLPSVKKGLPSAIQMKILYDSTAAINESIYEVIKTIVEAAVIVMVIIALFMGSFRAIIIPIVTIPLSLVGVIIMMQIFGFSLNLLTLLAMVLAIGLVVDDAIVVVENVDRHIKNGMSPFLAAIKGSREIAVPVISMTITLIAVYAPIALMGGVTGTLFKEFSLTLAGAVFISGIIALTLSPMMCAKFLKHHANPNVFERKVEASLRWISKKYEHYLKALMAHRMVVVVFAILVFASLPVMLKFIPSELAPKEDNGAFMLFGNAPQNANLDYVQAGMKETTDTLKTIPDITSTIAFSGTPNANQGMAFAMLKPWSKREMSQDAIITDATKKLNNNPTMAMSAFPLPSLPGGSGGLPVQFVITTSHPFEKLYTVASKVGRFITNSPEFVFSKLDLNFGSGSVTVEVNRDKAGAYGVTMQAIGNTLSTMMGDGYLNRINLDGRAYEVIPQTPRKHRLTPDSLGYYYVKSSSGKMIPLKSLITIKVSGEPRALSHFNQMNSATISMVPAPGTTIGQAVSFLKERAAPLLPLGYNYSFLGEAGQYAKEGNSLSVTFILALLVIFLVLAIQFESMRDPLVILVSVPLAVSGALICMAWGLSTMNLYTQVGLITLIGLMSKHGILICEVAKERQLTNGDSRIDAVLYAANLRLRAILMTTVSMLAGLFPLLLAVGPGAVSRFDMGMIIISGLGVGTLFTLFVLPVVYSMVASKHKPLPVVED